MKIKDVPLKDLYGMASSAKGLRVVIGSFRVRVHCREKSFINTFSLLYQDFELSRSDFNDFHIALQRPLNLRRWYNRQIIFCADGQCAFEPFPLSHAMPLFEWGLNWFIARRSHQYLMLHAGVVEKKGSAIIFPALPGSGKSTLSAALSLRGWRFLSDEFGLVRASDGLLQPLPRPVPLKNESIGVIRKFAPEAIFGPQFPKTRKGTVAHLKPVSSSVENTHQLAHPRFVIFPQYTPGSETTLTKVPKHYAFLRLATNAFNYEVMREKGFFLVRNIIDRCACFNLTYSSLDDVCEFLDKLIAEDEKL